MESQTKPSERHSKQQSSQNGCFHQLEKSQKLTFI
nr:unnamed protein product [Callosobruchus chinensis]